MKVLTLPIQDTYPFTSNRYGMGLLQNTAEFVFSKRIKEDLRAKICPPVIWTGQHKIEKVTYNVEVH